VRVKTDVIGNRASRRDALILARHFSAGTTEIRLRSVPLGTAEFYGRAFSLFIRPYGTNRRYPAQGTSKDSGNSSDSHFRLHLEKR
jgi:hypothetical protein